MTLDAALLNATGLLVSALLLSWLNTVMTERYNYANIFAFVWMCMTLGSQTMLPVAPRLETVVVLYGALLMVLLGACLVHLHARERTPLKPRTYCVQRAQHLLWLLVLCGVLAYTQFFADLLRGGSVQYWASIRLESKFEQYTTSPMYALFARAYILYVPLAMLLYRQRALGFSALALIVVIAFVTSAAEFTRAPVLQVFTLVLTSAAVLFGVSRYITLYAPVGISLISLFVGMQYVLAVNDPNASGTTGQAFTTYFFASPLAYEDILAQQYPTFESIPYSTETLNFVLLRLQLIDSSPSLVREYAQYIVTNTYTYLDAFTLDLGVIGAMLGSLVTGMVAATAFGYQSRSYLGLVVYAFVCYSLSIAFLNNEFIRFSAVLFVAEAAAIDAWLAQPGGRRMTIDATAASADRRAA